MPVSTLQTQRVSPELLREREGPVIGILWAEVGVTLSLLELIPIEHPRGE